VVERSRDDVLARFGALCDEALGELPTALAARVDASAEPALLQRVLAPRGVASDGSGSAACFAGLGEDGLAGLLGRARAFSATHDLSRLGKLRVAFVRPLAPRRSRVLLVTADGPVHLPALLARGKVDVPGSDPLPLRPKGGVRVLSAEVRGTPHAVAAYRVAAPLRPALTAYTTALRGAGFERSVDLTPAVDADAEPTRSMLSEAYRRGHEAYVITASPDGAGSLLSVLRLGREAIPGPFAPSPGAFDDPALPSGARSLRR